MADTSLSGVDTTGLPPGDTDILQQFTQILQQANQMMIATSSIQTEKGSIYHTAEAAGKSD